MQNNRSAYNLLLGNYFQYEKTRLELVKLFYRKAIENGKPVDCYIDLNNFLSPLYKKDGYYTIDDKMSIAASVINYCAHIVEFFASRFDMPTKVYAVYGNTRPISAVKYIPEYNAHNTMEITSKEYLNTVIAENLELLSIIIPYIPNVYFIRDGNTEPAVIMRSLIREMSAQGRKNARFIFTKDAYDFQLVGTCPNTHVVSVKKTMNGEMTFTISFFDFYKKILHLKTEIGKNISPELYSLYMAYAGCKDRNIPALVTWPRIDKAIRTGIGLGQICNGYNQNIRVLIDGLDIDPNLITNRFNGLDIVQQEVIYKISPSYANLTKNILDLYDAAAVRDINNKYFRTYPLDLNVF